MSFTANKNIDRKRAIWLENVLLPGEAAHAGKNFKELWAARRLLFTVEEQVAFSVNHANGSARLGMGQLSEDAWTRARICNSLLIRTLATIPGSIFQIGFQPQYLYPSLQHCWIANSSFLTYALWRGFGTLTASGGAIVYLCLSNQYRSNVKHCTLMHATLLSIPDKACDGPTQFLEVNYNPYLVEGLDAAVVNRAFSKALRNQKRNREPIGQFEQLMAGSKLDPSLANADLVWGGPIASREPLCVYWPEASAKKGKQRPINLEGVLAFRFDADQYTVLLRLLNFMNFSYEAGYIVSNNALDDANSSVRTTIRALVTALTLGTENHIGEKWTADALLAYVANLATNCLWCNKKSQTGHSILDIDRFIHDATKISPYQFMENVQSILSHPTMMNPFAGQNAYITTYMCNPSVPHNSADARKIYRADAELAIELLEEKEQLIRNI